MTVLKELKSPEKYREKTGQSQDLRAGRLGCDRIGVVYLGAIDCSTTKNEDDGTHPSTPPLRRETPPKCMMISHSVTHLARVMN